MKVEVKKRAAGQFRRGLPLIKKEDLVKEPVLSTDWIVLVDQNQQFVAKGYFGKQNKGIGWILSDQEEPFDHAFFARKFSQAKDYRRSFYQEKATNAFRLVNGEGDGLGGLIIDYYDGYALFSWYNETLYAHRSLICEAFEQVFPEIKGIYEKIRFQSDDLPESRFVFGETAPEPLLVKENGVTYATYMDEGLMTGIFLDQKEVRGALAEGMALGKRVLNMFSYTGAFSVAAAMGGALETTSVDLAKRSQPKTSEQFEVNGLDLSTQRILVMDVFDYFKYAVRKGLTYDLIVLDPPSFARNKKKVFQVTKNYGELVADSVDILEDKGILVASTNAANLPAEQFQTIIETAFKEKGVTFKAIEQYRLPADFKTIKTFPEGDYLKVFVYQVIHA